MLRPATVCHLGTISLRTGKKLTWADESERFTGQDAVARKPSLHAHRRDFHRMKLWVSHIFPACMEISSRNNPALVIAQSSFPVRRPQTCRAGGPFATTLLAGILAAFFLLLISISRAQEPAALMKIGEILKLPESSVRGGVPVVVRGLLTYFEPGHRMAFLQDETGAIYLHVVSSADVAAGDQVEVHGFVDPGWAGTNIRGAALNVNPIIRKVGEAPYPEPLRCESAEQLTGHPGAVWSSITMTVRAVTLEGDRARLDGNGSSQVPVFIAGVDGYARLPAHLKGMTVEVRGVMAESPVSETPLVMQKQFLVPGMRHIIIPPAEMARQFQYQEIPIVDLRWMPERVGRGKRFRTQGGVTWVKPGEGFFMQQGTVPGWVVCTMPELPVFNQYVDCAGVAASYQGVGILEDAVWKPAETNGIPITPEIIPRKIMGQDFMHGRYVTLEGQVVDHFPGPTEELTILSVEGETVLCHLSAAAGVRGGRRVAKDSRIKAEGVWINRPSPAFNTVGTLGAFHLLIRTPGDIKIIADPPFWNMTRVLIILGCVLTAKLLGVAWLMTLRRRVKEQAETIRETASKQAVEEERVRIAREWHDSFEQHFAGLTMLLDGASSTLPENTPMWTVLKRATRMADRSRSEARQAIWDLRTSALHADDSFCRELEEGIRRIWPSETPCELVIACESIPVPRNIALHLLRIAHEAVTNALKHSGSAIIEVSCRREEDVLRLSIRDEGSGLEKGLLDSATASGHFGVLGMRERALRIDGNLEILSPPPGYKTGTLVTVSVSSASPSPFHENNPHPSGG
jgi:signal transduction histidine kinase